MDINSEEVPMKKLIAVLMLPHSQHDSQRAAQTPSTPAAPAQSATRRRRQTAGKKAAKSRQEKAKAKAEGRSQELKLHRPSRAAAGPEGGTSPPFCFVDTIAGPIPSAARLKSPA